MSTPAMTFAVKVENGIVTEGAPIIRKFIGQPATNLGTWARKRWPNETSFTPLPSMYRYRWGNNVKRIALKGRTCVIVASGRMRSVQVRFLDTGQTEIVSSRALAKIDD